MGVGLECVIVRILQFLCTALLDRIVPYLFRLCIGLYDDAAPALDFDVQVVAIQHPHTHGALGAWCRKRWA